MPSSPTPDSPPPDRPLRLAFFGDANSVHVRRWTGWFASRGHNVTLLVPAGLDLKPGLPGDVSVEPFRAYYHGRFRLDGYIAERRSLHRLMDRLRPDVVHAHFLTEYGWHAWISGFHPYVITVWGSDVTVSLRRSRRTALYGRFSLRSADLVTGDSASLVEDVIAAGARRDRTRLIQFGVNTARFGPGPDPLALRRRLDLVGRRVLFSPRLIRPLYRHGIAVETLRSLPEDVVLLMSRYQVDEAELASVLARARALGVAERVRTVPGIDHGEMPDFYRMAEAVLTIPETDATPVTLLEAMACERPVVATDLPSVREWLGDLDPEALVPVGDVAATAAAIAGVLNRSAGEHLETGRKARAIVEERAGQDVHMRSVEAAYRQLAAEAKPAERVALSHGRDRPLRILLSPIEIAGYYASLEAGFRELGVDALSLDLEGNPFGYGRDPGRYPMAVRLSRRLAAEIRARQSQAIRRWLCRAARALANILVLVWAIYRYDVFVFSFGQTLLRTRELPLLRWLGKRIVFVFHGSDARPPYVSGGRMAPDRAMLIEACIRSSRRAKSNVNRIERYAHAVVAQPAFSHFFERPVFNFFAIGVPWRDRSAVPEGRQRAGKAIRILHSPSDPIVKGSARIREVIDALKAEGLALELVELQGVPNDVVLQELADCDFAIDQIYSDAPMVGFATEAAVAGKPSIVGGYAWPENHRVFGDLPMPPVEECAPEELAEAIRRLASNEGRRRSLGAAARTYVLDRWSRAAIARRFLTLIEGERPPEWMFDPHGLRYVEGCGLTRDDARANVRAVIAAGGPAALCLSDKPELEALFVAFAADG